MRSGDGGIRVRPPRRGSSPGTVGDPTVLERVNQVLRSTPIGIQAHVGGVRALPRHTSKIKGALARFASEAGTRLDSWINNATGFGTTRDKTTYGFVLPNRMLEDTELSALYHADDMAARMVDVVPQEMLREGFVVETGNPDDDSAMASKLEELEARSVLADGIRWGRCYGGGAILLGADDGRDSSQPLIPERAKDLSYLYVLDRRLLWPLSYYDEPGHPKMGKARSFLVTSIGGMSYSQQEVHESRLVLFGGAPTGIREKVEMAGWDMSVLQRAYDVLRQFNTGWKAVETMMVDGNQAIFKMGGLEAILSAPGGGDEMLRQRLQAMDLYRSVMRAIVIDADGKESFERHSASFSEIPQTLDKFMLRLAATVEMPVTILMGQSPAGMNATGESDFRWFYDRIRAKQNHDLTPRIRRIAEVWLATRAGRAAVRNRVVRVTVKYPALWTETPLAQAQRESAVASRDKTYIDAGVLMPDEVALARFRPEGFQNEIVLSKEAVAARERALALDLEKLGAKAEVDDDATIDPAADPLAAGTPAIEGGGGEAPIEIPLAPTDVAVVVTVNEARRSLGLPAFSGADGEMTMTAYKAQNAELLATATAAAAGTPPGEEPAPSGFGGFGGGPPADEGDALSALDEDVPLEEEDDDNPFAARADAREAIAAARALPTSRHRFARAWDACVRVARVDARVRLDGMPRTFTLYRKEDETGVSGTGEVAHGCLFDDGKVAMRWRTATASTTIFDSIDEVIKVHGHAGKTEIRWHAEESGRLDAAVRLFRVDASSDAAQDKAAKKAAAEAKTKSKSAWAATAAAQAADKAAQADPTDKALQAKAAKSNKDAAKAHGDAKSAWEDAANTARPGTGRFLSATAVVQDHASHAAKHSASASAAGGGDNPDGIERDEEGRFA